MGCYFHFSPRQDALASLSEEEMQRGNRKREHDEHRVDYLRNKGYKIVEVWSVTGGKVLMKRKMSEIA